MENIPEEVRDAVKFHGHLCPGLVLGYRVAKLARNRLALKRSPDEELVAIVENDTCAVDAIQFINGATFGKGNLIFKDHGLHVYTFIERNSGKKIRIALKSDVFKDASDKRHEIMKKTNENEPLSEEEKTFLKDSRSQKINHILTKPDQELFYIKDVEVEIPEKARIFNSVKCSKCGLSVMETRARLLNDRAYCIPCWKEELDKNKN
ncbi:MAG: formylmethanofuran dehydrogenase [Candidatus Lokiarchaeota archaeon]|nr:formylmethanofuran dehydrogenase [Candidatus Lokiarchaeota archaeon]